MTYFISDTNDDTYPSAEWTLEMDAIRDAHILAVGHGQKLGCLFPGDHDLQHPVNMKFRVTMHDRIGLTSDEWEELTEAEMQARYIDGATGALTSSQFDFWWE